MDDSAINKYKNIHFFYFYKGLGTYPQTSSKYKCIRKHNWFNPSNPILQICRRLMTKYKIVRLYELVAGVIRILWKEWDERGKEGVILLSRRGFERADGRSDVAKLGLHRSTENREVAGVIANLLWGESVSSWSPRLISHNMINIGH